MKKDLEKVGLFIQNKDDYYIKLYFINNPDGSPRWIWNSQNPKPDFLRFYTISSLRSKLFSIAIRVIFFFRIQHVIFRKNSIKVCQDKEHLLTPFTNKHFTLFTGTPGPNRKIILFSDNQFIKVALDNISSKLVNNEIETLKKLVSGVFIDIPECKQISDEIVVLSDLGKNGKRNTQFSKIHAAALGELYTQNPRVNLFLSESNSYKDCIRQLESYRASSEENRIPHYLKEKLFLIAERIEKKRLSFNWTHRDFTPWNCFESLDKIRLYDFELAHPQLPFGFDAFHFVMQQGILVDRLTWKQIEPLLNAAFVELKKVTGKENESYKDHLQAYLLINTAYHIELYSRQEKWHEQIHWLLNTWNEALSDLLKNKEEQRTLVIGDVFDFLKNEKYAAIKFPNIHPKTLCENTDIDILMHQKTAEDLYNYIKKHSLVKKIQLQKQSKMMSLLIILHNDQLLALDLIWKLKVKALDFMDVKSAIKEAVKNDFDIKVLNLKNTQEYIRCFYGLNASAIPQKYQQFFKDESLKKIDALKLKKDIKNKHQNKGFHAFVNSFFYISDTIRQYFFQKGMVITFSGVDGAGKSTIIELTKNIIEKKFRKKVIVIRHRPSLLPILSAITQGKQKAEQKAASTLPRLGKNKSRISSLLRFGYYYSDYLFGQYYIYLKHVLRGDIILYDRYYFDFINDSLRSNIQLPKWFTKAGYKFLLKPHLNFFLYADAEVIISRKKELDALTITTLTQDYLKLFTELDKNKTGKYFPIENLNLNDTMTFITSKTQSQLF